MTRIELPDKIYFKIGEVSELLELQPHVLRYWETEFDILNPVKSKSGQRLYRRRDVEILSLVKDLLYKEKYTIKGARQHIRDLGIGKALEEKQERDRNDHRMFLEDLRGRIGALRERADGILGILEED